MAYDIDKLYARALRHFVDAATGPAAALDEKLDLRVFGSTGESEVGLARVARAQDGDLAGHEADSVMTSGGVFGKHVERARVTRLVAYTLDDERARLRCGGHKKSLKSIQNSGHRSRNKSVRGLLIPTPVS